MTSAPIGLIVAMPEELRELGLDRSAKARMIGSLDFHRGRLGRRPVVAVECGIGKVNAAIATTLLIREFSVSALVVSGVAGSLSAELGIGDVVIADRLVMHDYGRQTDHALEPYQPGVPPLPGFPDAFGFDLDSALRSRIEAALADLDLPELSAVATCGAPRRPAIRFGTVLTGDQFLDGPETRDRLRVRFGALAIEMEGAAVAQVAARFGLPSIVVRAASDLAGGPAPGDFFAFLSESAKIAAAVTSRVIDAV